MKEICPKTPKCPLFNDNLLLIKKSSDVYKALYCNSEEKFKQCKRYIVSEEVGKCADFVMPNSTYSLEEIIEKMKEQDLI